MEHCNSFDPFLGDEFMDFCMCRVRMHYGHPDVFDRVFHLTRGGFSKASKIINISEDIYAGLDYNNMNDFLKRLDANLKENLLYLAPSHLV